MALAVLNEGPQALLGYLEESGFFRMEGFTSSLRNSVCHCSLLPAQAVSS